MAPTRSAATGLTRFTPAPVRGRGLNNHFNPWAAWRQAHCLASVPTPFAIKLEYFHVSFHIHKGDFHQGLSRRIGPGRQQRRFCSGGLLRGRRGLLPGPAALLFVAIGFAAQG